MSTKNNYGVRKVSQPRFEFPAPPEGEEWHNPERLSAEQVGEGSRLLTCTEAVKLGRLGKKQLKRLKIEVCLRVGTPDEYWSNIVSVQLKYTYRLPAETLFSWQREYNPNKFYGHINAHGNRRMVVATDRNYETSFSLRANPCSLAGSTCEASWAKWQECNQFGTGDILEFDTLLELAEWMSGK